MKILSKHAQLSREYTNLSIRATSATIVDQYGFEARHIMCISGHKSETSIRSYASKTSDGIKLAIFSGLSNALCDVPDKLPIIGHMQLDCPKRAPSRYSELSYHTEQNCYYRFHNVK